MLIKILLLCCVFFCFIPSPSARLTVAPTPSVVGSPSYSPVALASGNFFMNTLINPVEPYISFGYAVSVTKSYTIVGGPQIGRTRLKLCWYDLDKNTPL